MIQFPHLNLSNMNFFHIFYIKQTEKHYNLYYRGPLSQPVQFIMILPAIFDQTLTAIFTVILSIFTENV